MSALADQWYTSGTSLGVAGIVVGVVGAIIGITGVWAAFRAADPRQEILYKVSTIVPILANASRELRDDVEVRCGGEHLDNPQILQLYLVNPGSGGDIAFDQERPLRIKFGARVVKVLNLTSNLDGEPPEYGNDKTSICIKPDLIKRRQMLKIALLLDGENPQISVPDPQLPNVEVREHHGDLDLVDPDLRRWARLKKWMAWLGGASFAVGFMTASTGKETGQPSTQTFIWSPAEITVMAVGFGVCAFALLIAIGASWKAGRIQSRRDKGQAA